jgi:two-component system, cell cycle sensor histidine kinase and response regulator CckA
VVLEAESLVRRLVGEDVAVHFLTSADERGTILAEPGQIEQVLMNLVVNARDAMPTGGQLTIATRHLALNADEASRHTNVEPGSYGVLSVTDTGHGMMPETRSKIFEPFFTTKAVGKGSGLGLSTVYAIVSQLGGTIEVWSEPERGARFDVYLPLSEIAEPVASGDGVRFEALSGNETILIVDDEPPVAHFVQRTLAAAGYTVLTAHHPREAVRLWESHPSSIHLVVTDVVMPQMSGRELAERLVALSPACRVLYISGYSDDVLTTNDALGGERQLLRKPFTGELLLRRVREALDLPLPDNS